MTAREEGRIRPEARRLRRMRRDRQARDPRRHSRRRERDHRLYRLRRGPVHPGRVRDPVSEPTKWQCPACGEIVDKADLIQTETPEDFEEVDVSDLDAELPEKYRGRGAVKCHVRAVHIYTDCVHCHDKHVH